MPTLHDLMASSIDGRTVALVAADASPAGVTRSLISRRRRRNAAVAGGSSALAIGGLVAAVVTRDRADATPASPEATAYVEVQLGQGDGNSPLGWAPRPACGDQVPTASGGLDGLSQELQLWGGDGVSIVQPSIDPQKITSRLRYEGDTTAPVFADAGYAVVAKDGVIVATVGEWHGASGPFGALDDGWNTANSIDISRVLPCDAVGREHTLPAGDYELYVISQVHASEEDVALENLRLEGYTLAPSYGQWAPGSIDCSDYDNNQDFAARTPEYPLPLECDPAAVPGATLDLAGGVASLPYSSADYAGDVDVTLVSEPIRFTATEELWVYSVADELPYEAGTAQDDPDGTLPSDIACGVDFDHVRADLAVTAEGQDMSVADLESAAGVPLRVDTASTVAQAEVVVGESAPAWLISRSSEDVRIVGSATANLSPSGTFSIDRWTGYPDVSVRLTDVTWCGDPFASIGQVVMITPVTVTVDGTDTTSKVLDIQLSAR